MCAFKFFGDGDVRVTTTPRPAFLWEDRYRLDERPRAHLYIWSGDPLVPSYAAMVGARDQREVSIR